jgi:polyhydroxyalkanoate synthesis regulator phasin
LAPLVANGTLSEEQVAAIVDHLQADRAAQAAEARNKVLKKLRSVRSGWSQRP